MSRYLYLRDAENMLYMPLGAAATVNETGWRLLAPSALGGRV